MAALSEGDIVVLVSGSPRFVVESIQSTKVSCVWCNEGQIHRDTFDMSILRKWEASDTAPSRGGDRGGFKGGDRGGDRGASKVATVVVIVAASRVVIVAPSVTLIKKTSHFLEKVNYHYKNCLIYCLVIIITFRLNSNHKTMAYYFSK
jgi:uncharacterized protein YodC (DUF2158 family)